MSESKKRILKTMVAVLIAMMLYVILLCVDKLLGINHKEWLSISNMYTPFFSAIAAIYVISKYAKDSIKSAKRRSLGSVIGGIYGMVLSLLIEFLFLDLINLDINNIDSLIVWKIIQFTIVGISLVPLIVIIKRLKLDDALFITGLTYFSVTISIRNGGMPVIQFAFNRIFSTVIGVGIALLINHFYLFKNRNKDITFICSFENKYIENDFSFDNEEIYFTNRLYECDVDLIYATSLSLGELGRIFKEVDCNKPLIIMDGAAVYDSKDKKVIYVDNIDREKAHNLRNVLLKYNRNVFSYSLINDKMVCYYQLIINDAEQDYFSISHESESFRFVYGETPSDLDICSLSVIVLEETLDSILNDDFIKDNNSFHIEIENYKDTNYKKICFYNYGVSKLKAFNSINDKEINQLVVIGDKDNDIELMKKANISMCFVDSNNDVKDKADIIINSTSLRDGLKCIKKIYHSKNIEKTIKKLKTK